MGKDQKHESLAEQVRELLIKSGLSQHQIAKATGVKQPGLSKFMNGGSLKIETLGLLLDFLQVKLSGASLKPQQVAEGQADYDIDASEPAISLDGLDGQKYSTILIDPPWRFQNRTGKMAPEHRRLARYETMSLDEIKALPIASHAAQPSHLYMWCPNALLREGLEVMDAWGFTYKTNLVWYKVRKDGGPDGRGVGFYFRNVTELVLFGVKGSMRTLAAGRRQVNLFATKKREHSRKPAEFYDIIEQCSPGPYLEVFARERVKGWTCWGNEVDSYEQTRPLHRGYNNRRTKKAGKQSQLTLNIA